MITWKSLERPGYLGAFRNQRFSEWDQKFGQGNWRLGWLVNGEPIDFLGACELYEDAYFEFMVTNLDYFYQLCLQASEVYDDSPSNVESGFDYNKQETEHTHLQDIAIRRCLFRLGVWFQGHNLIQIRDEVGKHRLSMIFSPGRIAFHKGQLIHQPELEGWWEKGSVEAFYQSNKFLQVKLEE